MKKTSVYLEPEHLERLRHAAAAEGRSQAEILREAIIVYTTRQAAPRTFEMAGIVSVPGLSAADLSEEELLDGFGG